MKILLSLMVLISFSVSARSFEDVVWKEKCNIEVTKDIIIPYGYMGINSGSVNIQTRTIDKNNNRRLKAGRILKIMNMTDNIILLDDASVHSLCVLNGYGGCTDLDELEAEKFESYSGKTMRLNCEKKPTIDI